MKYRAMKEVVGQVDEAEDSHWRKEVSPSLKRLEKNRIHNNSSIFPAFYSFSLQHGSCSGACGLSLLVTMEGFASMGRIASSSRSD